MSSTDARIAQLRQAMSRRGLTAYIVPSSDPHLSEYLPARWQGRRWLSGFTGSVGTLGLAAALGTASSHPACGGCAAPERLG